MRQAGMRHWSVAAKTHHLPSSIHHPPCLPAKSALFSPIRGWVFLVIYLPDALT